MTSISHRRLFLRPWARDDFERLLEAFRAPDMASQSSEPINSRSAALEWIAQRTAEEDRGHSYTRASHMRRWESSGRSQYPRLIGLTILGGYPTGPFKGFAATDTRQWAPIFSPSGAFRTSISSDLSSGTVSTIQLMPRCYRVGFPCGGARTVKASL